MQADKLSKYADWAALIVSGKKTCVTGILHKAKHQASTEQIQVNIKKNQQKEKVIVQGQHAQFIRDMDLFNYFGVTLTMSLSWSCQHKCLTDRLTYKIHKRLK